MTAPISESWTRIENWLAGHAPATRAALAPPADPADIAELERLVDRPLLRPLVQSLLRHDGLLDQSSWLLPGSYRPLSARETADEWRSLTMFFDKRAADEEGDEAVYHFMKLGTSSALYGHPQLIPIARDICGGRLVLDHRPETDRGRVHEVESVEGVMRGSHEMWTSLPMLMERIATSLETGEHLDGYAPVVNEEHRLSWDFTPLR
ncbi:SMI1/KNR4 family protein [Streptomyces verrucosisporus]|uniref:SMI1/KNR4 family protein n=1 Tax=Streptomyces verrucosisporus TaxID=1695161 RepID=UPI0019D28D4D|nr:SMI1/KNR4 family protein [Streptomyces verrucosisporus]MBN3928114.1 SMI1/KNR4 family protein [Streptomyces verrucosisporus]